MTDKKLEAMILDVGFIGLSEGDELGDKQAVIWGGDVDFWFYPVSLQEADDLLDWYSSQHHMSLKQQYAELREILGPVDLETLDAFVGLGFPDE